MENEYLELLVLFNGLLNNLRNNNIDNQIINKIEDIIFRIEEIIEVIPAPPLLERQFALGGRVL